MKNRLRYVTAILLAFFPFFSYAQRLLLEDAGDGTQMVIIDGYGMNKDVLAVTEAEQRARKNEDGSTKSGEKPYNQNDDGKDYTGLFSPINRVISAKFEISPRDIVSVSTRNYRDKCKNLVVRGEAAHSWRAPTLNEALLMVLFYDQMESLAPRGFVLPSRSLETMYLTSTVTGNDNYNPMHFFYYWVLAQWPGREKPIAGYYSVDSSSGTVFLLRCIRDIPQ